MCESNLSLPLRSTVCGIGPIADRLKSHGLNGLSGAFLYAMSMVTSTAYSLARRQDLKQQALLKIFACLRKKITEMASSHSLWKALKLINCR